MTVYDNNSSTFDSVFDRIDKVLKDNRGTQNWLLVLTVLLFLCGLAGIIVAIVKEQYLWSIPSAFTSAFMYYPIRKIEKIRRKNIALAAAPALIEKLPPEKAAEEIQRLIGTLYGDD